MRCLVTKQMVALAVVAVIVALCTSSAQAQDANDPNNDNLFDVNRVLTFNITMDPCDWETIRNFCPSPDGHCDEFNNPYYPATVNCGTLGPMLIGIHRKSDLGEPNWLDPQKVSLKLDINLYVPGQTFAGKRKLSLEMGAYGGNVTEGLAWQIYRRTGIVSGRSAWCNVYINGDYKGVYANVEQVDKAFLTDNGIDNRGWLYKREDYGEDKRTHEDPCLPNPFQFKWWPFDHSEDPCYPEVPTPNDWLDQAQWRVNIPQLLTLAVAENFVANADGLVMKGDRNYWYYDWSTNPNDINDPNFQQPRLYFAWDLDTTIRSGDFSVPIMGGAMPFGEGDFQQALINEVNESGIPLGYPTHQADYLAIYDGMLDGQLELTGLLDMVNNIEAAVSTDMNADPYAPLPQEPNGVSLEFQRIRDWLTDRTDYVTMQLEMFIPPPGTVLLDDDFGGSVWDANWTNSGSWEADSSIYGQQLPSAKAPQKATGTLACIDLDTSDANAVYVKFSVNKDDTEVVEDIILAYYNGTSYVDVCDLDLLGDDDMWLLYSDKITDSNFFDPNFKIRFSAAPENGENVWVDDVIITKTIAGPALEIIYGHILDPNAAPVPGVSVDANNGGGSDTSDVNGYYEVNVPSGWSGTVTPTKTGYGFSPTDRSYVNVTTDQIDQDYTATLLTYTISGTVTSGGPGLDGVTMDGLPGNPVTAGGGLYSATVTYGWGGTVTPTKAGYTFVPASRLYSNVTSDQLNQDYDGTLLTYTISGTILDPGAAPVPGVSVDANSGGGSDTTDPNGEYSLTVNYDWSGTVTPTKTDYTFAPTDRSYSNVTSNQTAQDYTGTDICDLYPDGIFDLKDVDVICENWLTAGPSGDIDNSAFVDLVDFGLLADKF